MATKTWNVTSGEWLTSADWSGGLPSNSDTAVIANGGTVVVGSSDYSAIAQILTVSSGTLDVSGGVLQLDGLGISNGGSVIVDGGSLGAGVSGQGGTIFNVSGNVTVTDYGTFTVSGYASGTVAGTVTLENGGTYSFQDYSASSTVSNTINFTSTGGTFQVEQPWSGTIQNFDTSTSNNIAFGATITSQSYSSSTHTLTVHISGGTTYALKFADNANPLSSSNFQVTNGGYDIAFSGTVYQPPAPTITSATYDAATGTLTVTGNTFTSNTGDFDPTQLSITGEDGTSYNLTSGSVSSVTSTSFKVALSTADQLAVDGLLDKSGSQSTGNDIFNSGSGPTTYQISAGASFDTGGRASSGGITVSNALAPTITAVSYNPSTKVLTIIGTGFENSGPYGGVNLGQIMLRNSSSSYTFNAADYASAASSTQITINLSSATSTNQQAITSTDVTSAAAILAGSGPYLSASSGWDAGAGAAITSQGITISGAAATIASETFSSTSGTDIGVGKTVTFTVDFSAPVTVSGTPQLTLNDGESANYISGSTTSALTFGYTVSSGDNISDLEATAFNLNGGSVQSGGTNANLSGFTTINTSVTVDTFPPAVSSVTLDQSAYGLGSTVSATIHVAGSYDGNGAYVLGSASTIDGATLSGATYNSSNNTFTAHFTVSGGTTEVISGAVGTYIIVTDAAGNGFAASSGTIATSTTIDTHAPTAVSISGFANGSTDSGTIAISAGTVAGTLTTTDASLGDSFTYTLSGTDASHFTVSGSTLEVGGSALSPGQTYDFSVVAHDLGGNTYAQAVAVTAASGPTVTAANIGVAGATGSGGAFKIGDTVTATWNDTASGDNAAGVTGATFNFAQFGGGTALAATDSGGDWTATYTISSGSIDATGANVALTASTSNGSTTTTGTNNVAIDDKQPVVTGAHILLTGGSGPSGAFKIGDTVAATWNDTASGDNNTDTINAGGVTVDFSQFGGGSAVVATDNGGTWTASFTVSSGGIDTTGAHAVVTVTDHVGNTTSAAGSAATVDNMLPVVTAAHIGLAGATGSGGAYKIGDTVTATWNDTASGDNNTDTINAGGVTVDFSQFGGGSAVSATNSGGTWTASYTIASGGIATTSAHVAVTATDIAGNATTASAGSATVDDIKPVVTAAHIGLAGATGSGGAYKIGDTVTATWNNTASGDNNTDAINAGGVTVDFSQFGGGSAVVATNNGGTWTASYTVSSGGIDTTSAHVAVTATDAVGNATTTSGGTATVDDIKPVVTSAYIGLSGATGINGAYIVGNTVTATWNDTASGDNNSDTINAGGVTVDFSQFGGGSAVVATNNGGTWTASYTVSSGGFDTSSAHAAVTVTDFVGNATTTSGGAVTVATVGPIVSSVVASGTSPNNAASDVFTVTFSEAVTGVAANDFAVSGSGTVAGSVTSVTGGGTSWTVSVGSVTGDGTLGLNVVTSGAAIIDSYGNQLTSAYTSGQTYTIDHTPPSVATTPTVTAKQNSVAHANPIGIGAPSDNETAVGSLAITVTALPTDGTVTLSDGVTAVTSGETLTLAQLQGLDFAPTSGAYNQSSTFGYSVADLAGNVASGGATLDVGPPGVPTIASTHSNTTSNNAPLAPFTIVTINDPSSGTIETVTITLTGMAGTLAGAGLSGGTNGVYTLTGPAATVTSEIEALLFTPNATPNVTTTATFIVTDVNNVEPVVTLDGSTTVVDTVPAAGSTISVTQTPNGVAARPFANVTIADPNGGGPIVETLTITQTGPGTLSGTGLTPVSAGVYILSGSATAVTAALEALTFSGGSNTSFTLSDANAVYSGAPALADITVSGTGISGSAVASSTLIVGSGAVATGDAVASSTVLQVLSGGTAIGTTVASGGIVEVFAGAQMSGLTTSPGATVDVEPGDTLTITGGQAIAGISVLGGGSAVVSSGGTASGTSVSSGGFFDLAGGRASGTVVSAGGAEFVLSQGVDTNAVLSSGGAQVILAGGRASATLIGAGGGVFDAGLLVSATVSSGGFAVVSSGGTATATTLALYGQLFDGGVASGTLISAGAAETVSSGATSLVATALGGSELVLAGGSASGTVVSSGGVFVAGHEANAVVSTGFLVVSAGGVTTATTVSGFNGEFVSSGGTSLNATMVGGSEVVSAGGVASGTIMSSGGAFDFGRMVSASVLSGGFMLDFGTASATSVGSAANMFVIGTASGTTISTGGAQFVSTGGLDLAASVLGGSEVVAFGGTASGTTLSGGGEFVAGSAVSASLTAGAFMVVSAGGVASATTVAAGASLFVNSGGTDAGTTLSGGVDTVSSGGVISGTLTFAGSGTLILNQASNIGAGALVAGFNSPNDQLDLRNILYANGPVIGYTSANAGNTSGTLSVSAGGVVDTLTLIGQFSVGNFSASADGVGGTTIIDPPLQTSASLAPAHG